MGWHTILSPTLTFNVNFFFYTLLLRNKIKPPKQTTFLLVVSKCEKCVNHLNITVIKHLGKTPAVKHLHTNMHTGMYVLAFESVAWKAISAWWNQVTEINKEKEWWALRQIGSMVKRKIMWVKDWEISCKKKKSTNMAFVAI